MSGRIGDVCVIERSVEAPSGAEGHWHASRSTIARIRSRSAPFPEAAWGQRFVAVSAMYAADADRGAEVLAPPGALGGVDPFVDLSGRQQYVDVQRLFDANYPEGGHYYWSSLFLDGLPDEVLVSAMRSAAASPSPMSVVAFWQLGGAFDRADVASGAYAHRGAAFLLGVEANFASSDPSERAENIAWAGGASRTSRPTRPAGPT